MFDLQDTTLACDIEGCPGYYDWISTDGCYLCPVCGLEIWGGEPTRKVSTREAKEVYRLQQSRLAKMRKHGSGSSNGIKRRKTYVPNPNIVGVQPSWRGYDEV